MPTPQHINDLVQEIAGGDPAMHLKLIDLCRSCYQHVEESTKVARLEVLNALMDVTPPDTY